MPRSFGEPLSRLRAVPIEDNREPLVDPRDLSKRIRFSALHPKFPQLNNRRSPVVRRRVAQMVAQAAESLGSGVEIEILEGFRPIAQQRMMYELLGAEFAARHPEWNKATLHRVTNTLCAPPDDKCPPPHTTGGAVDLYLVSSETGAPLDVTSPFEWDETSAATDLSGLTPQARKNRAMLVHALSEAGLTNYAGEWWHWSYGDSGWALRTGAPKAIYGRLPDDAA